MMEYMEHFAIFIWHLLALLQTIVAEEGYPCAIPHGMQGKWYSYVDGVESDILIKEIEMSAVVVVRQSTLLGQDSLPQSASVGRGPDLGRCRRQLYPESTRENFFMFEHPETGCRTCIAMFYRTPNIMEFKLSTGNCVAGQQPSQETITELCSTIMSSSIPLETMFALTQKPLTCRDSFEAVYQFCYEKEERFSGRCCNPLSNITACQRPGTKWSIQNQRFQMSWKRCEGNSDSFDADFNFQCMGEWVLQNGNRYIAVANMGENQKHLKYRCFLTRKDQPLLMTMSYLATCKHLKNAYEGPFRLWLREVASQRVSPGCKFPHNFTGRWINTGNFDSVVQINSTHIYEVIKPDQQQARVFYYVCVEARESRYMVAKLGVGGCQVDYTCMDFLPRHQNIIRYRQSQSYIDNEFRQVCAWTSFQNNQQWKYQVLVAESTDDVTCPILGRFVYKDGKGDAKLQKKIEVTEAPRENVYCHEKQKVVEVCSRDPTHIKIDIDYCTTVDHRARPVGIYDIFDYTLKCVGFWKEDDRSYLITYDIDNPFNRYQCWVYRRVSYAEIRMSRAALSRCHVNQTDASFSASDGANLLLEMVENERLHDNCPLAFDDGSNPWNRETHTHVFLVASNIRISTALIALCLALSLLHQHMQGSPGRLARRRQFK